MFRKFASLIDGGADALFKLHPADLTALLEVAWDERSNNDDEIADLDIGHPARRSDLNGFGTTWIGGRAVGAAINIQDVPLNIRQVVQGLRLEGETPSPRLHLNGVLFDHLAYAFMIENTRIYEIFRRVVDEFMHGERLGTPASGDTQTWLRATEELFYRDPPPFFVSAINSHIRPDLAATRRNAYQRLLGMELNHGADDKKSYPYKKADTANNEFVSTFEEFLREVWIGIENVNNQSGVNPTDDAKIADLAERLFDMLRTRREVGNLGREEFVFTSMLSWFHLTVESNTPIVNDLKAQASSEEERLFKVAQRVGLPAHGLSKNYFDIADDLSRVLILIESGILNEAGAAASLYTPPSDVDIDEGTSPEPAIRNIIRHWSIITGRDLKSKKVLAERR